MWDQLNTQYSFDVDCCATAENTKCKLFCMEFENTALDLTDKVLWTNPPFSKAQEMFTRLTRERRWVAIYRGDNLETEVWQKVILPNCHWIFVFNGRTNYEGQSGIGARFNSVLIGRGVPLPTGLRGRLMIPVGNRA